MDEILQLLGGIGTVLDTPGRFVRTGLAGENPFPSIFDPEQGVGGRELLEEWGVLGANQEGFDAGDVLGFGAELALDPMNLLGGLGALKTLKTASNARRFNTAAAAADDLANAPIREAIAARETFADYFRNRVPNELSLSQPSQVIKLREVPEAIANNPHFAHMSPEDQLLFARGTPSQAAEAFMRSRGGVTEAHPIAQALGEREFRAFGFTPFETERGGTVLGMVPSPRPDLVFVANEQTLPATLNTTAHEALHSMSRKYPEEAEVVGRLISGSGDTARKSNFHRLGYSYRNAGEPLPFEGIAELLKLGIAGNHEENVANAIGAAMGAGAARQRFPLTDVMQTGDVWNLAEDAGELLNRKWGTDPTDARWAMGQFMEFLTGRLRDRNALVPAGPVTGSPPISLDTLLLSQQPFTYTERVPVPNVNRILALLGGYNTLAHNGVSP